MIEVLEDVELRIRGREVRARLETPDSVLFDLEACSLAEGLWALPVIEAIAREYEGLPIRVRAARELGALVEMHLRLRGAWCSAHGTKTLVVQLGARLSRHVRVQKRTLRIPARPFPKRAQHAWADWIDGAHSAGFSPTIAPPALASDRGAAREARAMLRAELGPAGGAAVGICATKRDGWTGFDELARRLADGLGARVLSFERNVHGAVDLAHLDPVIAAHVMALCGVVVGDAESRVHVAAAMGAPVISLHGATLPARQGVTAKSSTAVTAKECRCTPAKIGCLRCISAERVARLAEELAAERWPWDRLAQLGLSSR